MDDVAFHDLPGAAFPLTMRAYGVESGDLVWEESGVMPGALKIPALAREHGELVRIEIELATGEVLEAGPPESPRGDR